MCSRWAEIQRRAIDSNDWNRNGNLCHYFNKVRRVWEMIISSVTTTTGFGVRFRHTSRLIRMRIGLNSGQISQPPTDQHIIHTQGMLCVYVFVHGAVCTVLAPPLLRFRLTLSVSEDMPNWQCLWFNASIWRCKALCAALAHLTLFNTNNIFDYISKNQYIHNAIIHLTYIKHKS